MLKAIVILSLVALLSAAPADDKQTLSRPSPINPDVISDPKPKDSIHSVDDGHHHSHPEHAKLQPATVNGGATAHPLHKRETPIAPQKSAEPQPNLANGQKTPTQVNAPKASGQQVPVNNNQKPRQQVNNNQKPKQQVNNNQKPRQQVNNNQKSGQTQTQTNNQQKPAVNAQQPIAAQKPAAPISNSRVTREAPKVAEQKPAAPQTHVNDAHKTQPKEAPKPRQEVHNNQKSGQTQVNNQQKPAVNAQQPISAQKTPISNSRVTRDAPKVAEQKPAAPQTHVNDAHKTQPKEAPKPRQEVHNNQKSGQTQVNNQQKPVVNAQQPISAQKTPISNSRVTRDAPRVAEQKPAAPKVAEQKPVVPQTNLKPQPTAAPQNANQKSGSAPLNTQQKPVVNNARITRDLPPRVAEQKPVVPQSNVNDAKKDLPTSAPAHVLPNNHEAAQDSTVHKSAPQQPITPQKQPINTRVRRGAPNPAEQSKIVPSGHSTAEVTTESNGFKTGLFKIESITTPSPSNIAHKELSADEKKVQSAAAQHTSEHTQALPVHKREAQSTPTNIREPAQSYDSYGNQAPSYVHPKPISEVLKKQPKAAHHEEGHDDHEDSESEKQSPVTKEADPVTSKPAKSS